MHTHRKLSSSLWQKSMGVGEFLSSKATNEWILSERRREEWEMENYPEGEIREVRRLQHSWVFINELAYLINGSKT